MRKKRSNLRELTIPPAAADGRNATELIRAWIVEDGLHCSLKIGGWAPAINSPNPSVGASSWRTSRATSRMRCTRPTGATGPTSFAP